MYIYGLFDPTTLELRYIGKAKNPERRFREHIKESKMNRRNTHLYNWMRLLLRDENILPSLEILEECTEDNWEQAEQDWIAECKKFGLKLTNKTNGGDGVKGLSIKGRKFSKEHKENISIAAKRRFSNLEERKRASEANKGKQLGNKNALGYRHTDETKKRVSNTLRGSKRIGYWKGRSFSDEHRRNLSNANRGRIMPDEQRQKIREANLGRKVTEEGKKRMSEAAKLRWIKKRGQEGKDV